VADGRDRRKPPRGGLQRVKDHPRDSSRRSVPPMHFSRPRAPEEFADGQVRRSPRGGRRRRICKDAQADMPSGEPSGASCVQRFDDSRNSAIHTTYRISLRSSSLQEPRYPLPRVVLDFSCSPVRGSLRRFRVRRVLRAPGGAEGSTPPDAGAAGRRGRGAAPRPRPRGRGRATEPPPPWGTSTVRRVCTDV
jgi:hypothetical protein